MAVYVEQYGYFWKLSDAQWRDVVKKALAGETWDFDGIVPGLKRRPSTIAKAESGDSISYYTKSNKDELRQPLDWEKDAWLSEAYDRRILTHEDRRPMIEITAEVYKSLDGWTLCRLPNRRWRLTNEIGDQIGLDEQYLNDIPDRHKIELCGRFW